MEQKLGYSLIDQNNQELKFWNYEPEPNPIILPNGNHIHAPEINTNYSGYKLVERWQISNTTPGLVQTGQNIFFDGSKILVTLEYRNPTKQELMNYSADKRRILANGSVEIDVGTRTIPVWVDSESRSSMTGLVVATNIVPDLTIEWKGSDGIFYTLITSEIQTMALNTMSYIKALFDKEADVKNRIQNDEIMSFEQIDDYYK